MSRAERRRAQVQAEVHAALAEFAAAVEVRLHAEIAQNRRTQIELVHALQAVRLDLAGRDHDIARAIETAGRAVEQAAARMEEVRADRHALVEAVGGLTEAVTGRAISRPELPPLSMRAMPRAVGSDNGAATASRGDDAIVPNGERIVGGRVDGPESNGDGPGSNGDGRRPAVAEPAVRIEPAADTEPATADAPDVDKVECLVDGRWQDGYEVVQILQAGDVRQYKVRRADGSVLDHLLDPGEVRHPQPPPVPAGSGRPSVYWTRS
jgi:hypothetical protein